MKKNQEVLLLAIEDIYSENGVIDRRTLDEDEQLPLIDNESNQDNDYLRSIPFDDLSYYKKPSVSSLPVPRRVSVLIEPEGVLAPWAIRLISACIRRCHRAQSQPSTHAYLP